MACPHTHYLSLSRSLQLFQEERESRNPARPPVLPFRLEPPANGNVVRIVEFPPDKERNYGNQAEVFRQYGA